MNCHPYAKVRSHHQPVQDIHLGSDGRYWIHQHNCCQVRKPYLSLMSALLLSSMKTFQCSHISLSTLLLSSKKTISFFHLNIPTPLLSNNKSQKRVSSTSLLRSADNVRSENSEGDVVKFNHPFFQVVFALSIIYSVSMNWP